MLEAGAFGRKVARPATAKATVGSSSKEIAYFTGQHTRTTKSGHQSPPFILKKKLYLIYIILYIINTRGGHIICFAQSVFLNVVLGAEQTLDLY